MLSILDNKLGLQLSYLVKIYYAIKNYFYYLIYIYMIIKNNFLCNFFLSKIKK
jgi:hypothetical protein